MNEDEVAALASLFHGIVTGRCQHPDDGDPWCVRLARRHVSEWAHVDVERLRDAHAMLGTMVVLAERDGAWPHYTRLARKAYDAAGGTLR